LKSIKTYTDMTLFTQLIQWYYSLLKIFCFGFYMNLFIFIFSKIKNNS